MKDHVQGSMEIVFEKNNLNGFAAKAESIEAFDKAVGLTAGT